MMAQKLTLKQFNQIKSELMVLKAQLATDGGLIENYWAKQKQLLSYDLSDIPFKAWEDLSIISSYDLLADFSNTKANIDMRLISNHRCIFKSCNIKNLDLIKYDIDPKFFDAKTIQNNPQIFLSDKFSEAFQNKYYQKKLVLNDLLDLSNKEIEEIDKKDYLLHLNSLYPEEKYLLGVMGLKRIIAIYKESADLYDLIFKTNKLLYPDTNPFYARILSSSNKKEVCYEYIMYGVIKQRFKAIRIDELPKMFIQDNQHLLLLDSAIDEKLKDKYYQKKLSLDDVIANLNSFKDLPIEYFMGGFYYDFANALGDGVFVKCLSKHPMFFKYLEKRNLVSEFLRYLNTNNLSGEKLFYQTVKSFISAKNIKMNTAFKFNFKVIEATGTYADLENYDEETIINNIHEQKLVSAFNIDNIKRLEQDTKIFSNQEMFKIIINSIDSYIIREFSNGILDYQKFTKVFAKFLNYMRKGLAFSNEFNYDFIEGNFRNDHPEIFVGLGAPQELKNLFYKNRLTKNTLYNHPEYIPYLINTDVSELIRSDITVNPYRNNFVSEYLPRFGIENLLRLIVKYGDLLDHEFAINGNWLDEKDVEREIEKGLYAEIKNSGIFYENLDLNAEFKKNYPDVFIDFDQLDIDESEKNNLKEAFYVRGLSFDSIRKYPKLVDLLKDKDLHVIFRNYHRNDTNFYSRLNEAQRFNYAELYLIDAYGSQKFLELCSIYGNLLINVLSYMEFYNKSLFYFKDGHFFNDTTNEIISYEEMKKKIEDTIIRNCHNGYRFNIQNAPSFLKEKCPELFISEDAPERLKQYFNELSFSLLNRLPKLKDIFKDKDLKAIILRNYDVNDRDKAIKYFQIFGDKDGLRLGISKPETVMHMIETDKIKIMKTWYDKTGKKFIPDAFVMECFPIEEIDKFLTSSVTWSHITKLKGYAKNAENKEALLKLAYSFGVFHKDSRGIRSLCDFLTKIPLKIERDLGYIIKSADEDIKKEYFCNTIAALKNRTQEMDDEKFKTYLRTCAITDINNISYPDGLLILDVLKTLEKEKVNIDFTKDIFAQIYRLNADGSYTLTISQDKYPETIAAIRELFICCSEIPLVESDNIHTLFGGFNLNYDSDFRQFLIENFNEILNDNTNLISSVQRSFKEIKAMNSNRHLTWKMAVNYVQSIEYLDIEVGNEKAAQISSIAGYSQEDFEVLQKIYNYAKRRVYSSIPPIKKTVAKYTYEMLKLDDPLALAIGTLSDCCQELNNTAEVCMEHSLVDKNGRVFVIKDEEGNIVSQSWVWRNKNVLCFDNIEIPNKAFDRANHKGNYSNEEFANVVFNLYQQASTEMIQIDKTKYQDLLAKKMITSEQYAGLRLSKVTVGLGYNDIAIAIRNNATRETNWPTRPLPFTPPVELSRGLYTSDSEEQYILAIDESNNSYDGPTLALYNDEYTEYTEETFTEKELLALDRLAYATHGEYLYNLSLDEPSLFSEIAEYYDLDPHKTHLILHPNFALIYEVNEDTIILSELLYNPEIEENILALQIKLALEQIKNNKRIEINNLNEEQRTMYNKAINLNNELAIEGGPSYGR